MNKRLKIDRLKDTNPVFSVHGATLTLPGNPANQKLKNTSQECRASTETLFLSHARVPFRFFHSQCYYYWWWKLVSSSVLISS